MFGNQFMSEVMLCGYITDDVFIHIVQSLPSTEG